MDRDMARFVAQLLQNEIKMAVGCTEPVAIALAAAYATAALGEVPERVSVVVDAQTYRNAHSVGLPGTNQRGPAMSAALGVFLSPARGLLLFQEIDRSRIEHAERLFLAGKIAAKYDLSRQGLYIKVLTSGKSEQGRAVIASRHDQLVALEGPNAGTFLHRVVESSAFSFPSSTESLKELSLIQLLHAVSSLDPDGLDFLSEAAQINLVLGERGLKEKRGLGIGLILADCSHGRGGEKLYGCQEIKSEAGVNRSGTNAEFMGGISQRKILPFSVYAQAVTAAAVEARMAGISQPVATLGGSGNQGIATFIPVVLLAREISADEKDTRRALAVSALVSLYVKEHLGRLSPICGSALAGACGLAAAAIWLVGGTEKEIANAVESVVASLTGIACDGAKPSCALKVITGVETGFKIAFMSLNALQVDRKTGLVGKDVEETLDNLADFAKQGMSEADEVLLKILLK